jgi:hypothetical protein
MIIFLDDNKERSHWFRSEVPSAIIAETAEAAIKSIETQQHVNWLFLDHDLGGEEYINEKRPDTGMEVVKWIIQNKPSIGFIVIHSCNAYAAKIMMEDLNTAGYAATRVPFPVLKTIDIAKNTEIKW